MPTKITSKLVFQVHTLYEKQYGDLMLWPENQFCIGIHLMYTAFGGVAARGSLSLDRPALNFDTCMCLATHLIVAD